MTFSGFLAELMWSWPGWWWGCTAAVFVLVWAGLIKSWMGEAARNLMTCCGESMALINAKDREYVCTKCGRAVCVTDDGRVIEM